MEGKRRRGMGQGRNVDVCMMKVDSTTEENKKHVNQISNSASATTTSTSNSSLSIQV